MKTGLFTFSFILFSSLLSGQNQNLSQGSVFDGEPYISIDPGNAQHMVVAWMGYSFLNQVVIKTSVSFNAGQTWSSKVDITHTNSSYTSADPSLEFDGNGNVFLSYIDYSPVIDSGYVYIRKSIDGGLSWGNPVPVIGMHSDPGKRALDRPWITIDRTGGQNDGNIYITTMNASTMTPVTAPYNPYFIRSTDGGATFDPWTYLDTAGWLAGMFINNPMPSPAISSNGVFHAVYPSYVLIQNLAPQLIIASSVNGGNNFSYNSVFSTTNFFSDTLAKKAGLLKSNPADSNHLAFISLGVDYGDSDVFLRESFDAGQSWSAPLRINDDPMGNNRMQDLVWADFDIDGDLVISWRDRRNGSDETYQTSAEIWAGIRLKDSIYFSPNFRISDTIVAYDSVLALNGNDFMCIKLINDTLNAVWGDSRNGKLNIWFQRIGIDGTILTVNNLSSESLPVVNVYPNPGSSAFTIEGSEIDQVEVFDLEGKLVLSQKYGLKNEIKHINLEQFPKGVYIFLIRTTHNVLTKKVIKR